MSLKYKPVTHVIFDMDGLLLDTEKLYTIATQRIVDSYFPNPRKIYTWELKHTVMGFQTKEVSERMVSYFDLPITWEEYAVLAREQIELLMPTCEKTKGCERLVRHLYNKNVPICLATSSSKESYDVKTQNHQELFKLFHHKVLGTSDPDVKSGKPSPDIFLVAASRFPDNAKPENCLVFEDAPNGIKAAFNAGMQVVMVPDPNIPEKERENATQVIDSLQNFKPEDFGLPPFDDEN